MVIAAFALQRKRPPKTEASKRVLAGAFLAAFLAVVFFFAMVEKLGNEGRRTHLTYYRSGRTDLQGGVSL